MRSVRRRLSMPSTASLMWSGRLLSPGRRSPVSRSMFQPNFEVITTLSRNGATPSPRMRSHLVRAVGLGRVEEGDAAIEGGPDDVDHLGPGGDRRLIGAAHVLDAEADAGDLQRAQLAPSGSCGSSGGACAGLRGGGLHKTGQKGHCGQAGCGEKKVATA